MPEIEHPANQRSRRTRQAVLDATRTILEDDGFDALTMGAVAQRAGVSRRGVYLHFDSVAALISGLFDHIAQTEDLHESVDAVWRAADSVAALDAWAGHLASYHPRVIALDRALARTEQASAAAAAHRARVCAGQLSTCRRLARWLAADGQLADGWDVATAADLLYGLISSDVIGRLLDDRGWSQPELATRLSLLLRSTLAVDSKHAAETPRGTGHTNPGAWTVS